MKRIFTERAAFACLLLLAGATVLQPGPVARAATPAPVSASEFSCPASPLLPLPHEITLAQFLNEVATANLEYAAQRYQVSLAQAAVAAAREFQNPSLQVFGGRDVTHGGRERMPNAGGAALTQTLELGGKRKYRIRGARQHYAATAATLDDFLRHLRLDAAAAFADALARSLNAEQTRQSAEDLRRLTETQRERFRVGDISRADLLQTQVEEQQFQNERLAAEAEAESASIALSAFLGRDCSEVRLIPQGELDGPGRDFEVSQLFAHALQSRPDLVALRHLRDAAQSKTREEKAHRLPDVDVGLGWQRNSSSENSIAPSSEFDFVGLTLSFPLPLWNRNQAAIASAQFTATQAQKQLEAVELKTEMQIRQALRMYRGAGERVLHYQSGILQDAHVVLEAKRFSYQRGQSPLLELLDAQRRTYEVRARYNDALADRAQALVELQRAAGLEDIEF